MSEEKIQKIDFFFREIVDIVQFFSLTICRKYFVKSSCVFERLLN